MPPIIRTILTFPHYLRYSARDLYHLELILKWAAHCCAHENRSALAADLMDSSRAVRAAHISAKQAEKRAAEISAKHAAMRRRAA